MDFCGKSWILKTHWIVDQLLILARIPDCACFDVRILGPNVPVKSKLQHPPRAFEFLENFGSNFPLTGAEKLFKGPYPREN